MRILGSMAGVILVLLLLGGLAQVGWASMLPLTLTAPSALLMNAETGEVLFEKDADQPREPASMTKIVTALLILERGDLTRLVKISPADQQVGGKRLDYRAGDLISRHQLLYGLLLWSANNTAMALARDHSGSVEVFARAMTTRVAQLGGLRSSFANPHGLSAPDHLTTPRDLALVMREALTYREMRAMIGTKSLFWSSSSLRKQLDSYHLALLHYPGSLGGKTGWTNPAGHCVITVARRGGKSLIAVLFGGTPRSRWIEAEQMLNAGFGVPHATSVYVWANPHLGGAEGENGP